MSGKDATKLLDELSEDQRQQAEVAAHEAILDAERTALEYIDDLLEQIQELSPPEKAKLLQEVRK